jgi:hypothetical protein
MFGLVKVWVASVPLHAGEKSADISTVTVPGKVFRFGSSNTFTMRSPEVSFVITASARCIVIGGLGTSKFRGTVTGVHDATDAL